MTGLDDRIITRLSKNNKKMKREIESLKADKELWRKRQQFGADFPPIKYIEQLKDEKAVLEDDKKIFISECNELRTKKIKLEAEKAELIDDIKRIQIYVNDYNTDEGTDDYINNILKKYEVKK